jgi:hypothetical protein
MGLGCRMNSIWRAKITKYLKKSYFNSIHYINFITLLRLLNRRSPVTNLWWQSLIVRSSLCLQTGTGRKFHFWFTFAFLHRLCLRSLKWKKVPHHQQLGFLCFLDP